MEINFHTPVKRHMEAGMIKKNKRSANKHLTHTN